MKNGLTMSEVQESREKYGSNKLPEKKLKTPLQFFMETFEDRLNQILLGMMVVFAALAVFGQGSYSEPIGVGVVLLAIAFIGMKTGMKSQKSAKELKDRTSIRFCNVIRDGKVEHINTDDVVVGDLVIIQSGEAIPADGYLVEGYLKVDNSVLNGESEDCKKTPITECRDDLWIEKNVTCKVGGTKIAKSTDFVDPYSLFSGTTVTDGEGKMVVTHVGVGTVNGQTIMTIDEIEEQKTSLDIQLEDLAGQISKFGYIGAIGILVVLVIANIIQYGGVAEYFGIGWIPVLKNILTIAVTSLTIIVAAVPEGLPLIINLITAQNAKVMIKHNVLAKHTNKIPEAGNIQLLCTDKTGTLTVGKLVPVSNTIGDGVGNASECKNVRDIFKLNVVMNSSAMYDENQQIVGGNATERALLSMVTPEEYEEIASKIQVVKKQNFNSANKYSAVEVKRDSGTTFTLYKGAPEKLLAKATGYEDATGTHKIDKDYIQKTAIDKYTQQAMRVIATAYSPSPLVENELPDDLVIISFVAIRDDVRPEVPVAVHKMHRAGVQVMMVTGDVLSTAKAIAGDAGLLTSSEDLCMSADEFDALSDDEAKSILSRIKVIARATPNTKLRIVKLAQELGLCVGMTGDGTNDAPALKAADVGFSMGSGTDVCKEAGDIIITDDNFVSITDAVLLGRTFMHNVLKFLKFQLPINVGLVVLSIVYPLFFGIEAIAAVQILVINIVMDSLNSLSFGGEPAKSEYMNEKPIPKGSKLLSRDTTTQIMMSVITFLALFAITTTPAFQKIFDSEAVYATARFALLIFAATINGFNIRTDGLNLFRGIGKNKLFVEIAAAIFAMTFLLAQFGGDFMGCHAMNLTQWVTVIGLSLLVIPVDLTRKYIVNSRKCSYGQQRGQRREAIPF